MITIQWNSPLWPPRSSPHFIILLTSFCPEQMLTHFLNPIQTGLFLVFLGREAGGDSAPTPPLLNFENIKAMTTKLKRQIERQKTFPLRSATSADDVIGRHNNGLFSNGGHLGSAILDFLFFQNIQNPPKLITK